MNPISWLIGHSKTYWIIALIVSVYFGYRGWCFRVIRVEQDDQTKNLSTREKVIVHYVQDSIYNFVGSAAGFTALFLVFTIYQALPDASNIPLGTAAFLSFLSLVAILGISGVLPRHLARWIQGKGK